MPAKRWIVLAPDKLRPGDADDLRRYDGAELVLGWVPPTPASWGILTASSLPVKLWRYTQNPAQWQNWPTGYVKRCPLALFANEPDLEGWPSWYHQACDAWAVAGGILVEPARSNEATYRPDTYHYGAVSWHCYAGDFRNRDVVLARAAGRPVIGSEYARQGHQERCLVDLAAIPEPVALFMHRWEGPGSVPGYTLAGIVYDPVPAGPVAKGSGSMFLVQAGHLNIGSNVDAALRGQTGASGRGAPEVAVNSDVADRVVKLLQDRGVTAQKVDANFNSANGVGQDYAGCVSLHCQSNPPDQSGWDVGTGNPAQDGAAAQSANLKQQLSAQYEAATGLARQSWCQDNPNVQEYYLFNSLSKSTPFALIEMCNTDVDAQWAAQHRNRMAYGVANGILAYLGKEAVPVNDDDILKEAVPEPPNARPELARIAGELRSLASQLEAVQL